MRVSCYLERGGMTIQVERAHGLEALGIVRSGRVHWNLGTAALYEEALRRSEGHLAAEGPLVCKTGQHTGRSPNDKFVVKEPTSEKHVHWGAVNRPIDEAKFDQLHKELSRNGRSEKMPNVSPPAEEVLQMAAESFIERWKHTLIICCTGSPQ